MIIAKLIRIAKRPLLASSFILPSHMRSIRSNEKAAAPKVIHSQTGCFANIQPPPPANTAAATTQEILAIIRVALFPNNLENAQEFSGHVIPSPS
jgi:hypothetical protein